MADKKPVIYKEKTIVREANEFIEASYRFNTWEDRIFLMTLAQIKRNDEDFKEYKIYVRDLVIDYDINTHAVYQHMKKAAETLRKKKITIPQRFGNNDEGTFTTGLISGYGEVEKNDLSYVIIELHPKLKPYFLKLQQQFTQYNISFLMKMQSSHSRRIYKLLKQYEKIGWRRFTIVKLKEILCIEEDEYKKYYDFKRRFILKAQKDLSKYTDITFTFEEEKKGRKVVAITFYMNKNETQQEKKKINKQRPTLFEAKKESTYALTNTQENLFNRIKIWGITKATFLEYLSKRTEAHIQTCADVTQQASNIQDKGAYFVSLIKKEQVLNPKKKVILHEEQKKARQQAIEAKEKKYEQLVTELRKEQYKAEQDRVYLLLENPVLRVEIMERLEQHSIEYDSSLSLAENLVSSRRLTAQVHNMVLGLRSAEFDDIREQFKWRMSTLKNSY